MIVSGQSRAECQGALSVMAACLACVTMYILWMSCVRCVKTISFFVCVCVCVSECPCWLEVILLTSMM